MTDFWQSTRVYHCYIDLTEYSSLSHTTLSLSFVDPTSPSTTTNLSFVGLTIPYPTKTNLDCVGLTSASSASHSVHYAYVSL
jgi:hypothetical protein